MRGILEEISPDGGEKMEHLNEEKRMRTMTDLDMDNIKLEIKANNPVKLTPETPINQFKSNLPEDFNDLSVAGLLLTIEIFSKENK